MATFAAGKLTSLRGASQVSTTAARGAPSTRCAKNVVRAVSRGNVEEKLATVALPSAAALSSLSSGAAYASPEAAADVTTIEDLDAAIQGIDAVLQQAAAAVEEAGTAVEEVAEAAAAVSKAVLEEASAAVQESAQPVGATAQKAVQPAAAAVQEAVQPAVAAVQEAVQPAAAAVQEAVQPAAQEAAAAVQEAVQPAIQAAKGLDFSGLPSLSAPSVDLSGLQNLSPPSISVPDLNFEKALSSSGVDPAALSATTTAAAGAAKQVVNFLTTTDPVRLGEYALGAVAAYYLLPPLAKAGLAVLRGYSGDVQPNTVLGLLLLEAAGSNALVDIRSVEEKEVAGVPDLADSADSGKFVELEYVCLDGNTKLYDRLRNPTEVEVESTAVQIAALRELNKAQTLFVMDSDGDVAKAVARQLCKRGFSKVFTVAGGYTAWMAAKLRTKPWGRAAQRVAPAVKVQAVVPPPPVPKAPEAATAAKASASEAPSHQEKGKGSGGPPSSSPNSSSGMAP